MFIKVAGRAFEPATMMMLRLAIAFSLLLVVLLAQRGWHSTFGDMRALGWEGFALGIANGAIPFTLIAWGERHIDSGVAAIANASMPIFVVLLAIRFKPSETVRGLRLVGFLVGLVRVGVLAGVHPPRGCGGVAGRGVGRGRDAGGRGGVDLVRGRQPLGPAPDPSHQRARALGQLDARRAARAAALRPGAAPVGGTRLEGHRLGDRAGRDRNGAGADPALPRAALGR